MDDIVERLTRAGTPSREDGTGGNGLMLEARDEIIRLRERLKATREENELLRGGKRFEYDI